MCLFVLDPDSEAGLLGGHITLPLLQSAIQHGQYPLSFPSIPFSLLSFPPCLSIATE